MNKDKSIEIQKQVRDNAVDLQSEFLDMKNWEEQMKKKDELIQSTDDTCQVISFYLINYQFIYLKKKKILGVAASEKEKKFKNKIED